MEIPKIVLLFACILGMNGLINPQAITAQNVITGMVFEDVNKNNLRDEGEGGIAGVMVSNQREVVLTDEEGIYRLPVDGNTILFVTKPAGYNFHLNRLNLPQFYYIHQPEGSPELKYAGIEPTGKAPDKVDFGLIPSEKKNSFSVIAYGDPQPRNDLEISYYRDEIVNELATTESDFIIVLGDIMYDDLSLYDRNNRLMATLNRPVFNVYGNHDVNFDADDDEFARETFKKHYGPAYYSFEAGDVHFMILDNIDYLGYGENGNPQYRGGLDDVQMEWIKQNLSFVDTNKRIVLAAHIPLFTPGLEDVAVVNTRNRKQLFELLEPFEDVNFLAGHMHTNFHNFMGEQHGRNSEKPVHQIIASAASGSWWGGPKDENGIPVTIQRDGVPNGYHILTFDGTRYTERYKAAGHSTGFQMRIETPDPELKITDDNTGLLVNVFNGSERSKVRFRWNRGEWTDMKRLELAISPFFEKLLDENPDSFASWIQPVETNHIWHYDLSQFIEPGTHRIEVHTTDQFGHEFREVKIIEIE